MSIKELVDSRWKKIVDFREEHEKQSVNYSISPEWNRNTYEFLLKRMTLDECKMVIKLLAKSCFSCDQFPMKYETGLCEKCHQIAMQTSKALNEHSN